MSDGLSEAYKGMARTQKNLEFAQRLYESNAEYRDMCDKARDLKAIVLEYEKEIDILEEKARVLIENELKNDEDNNIR